MQGEDIIAYARSEAMDVSNYLSALCPQDADELIVQLTRVKRVFVGGAGRSLLAVKMFAMRLTQLGYETYIAGDVCTPGVKRGDLFLAASCSGTTQTTSMQLQKAKTAGARTALITAHLGSIPNVDCIVHFADPHTFPDGWRAKEHEAYERRRNAKSLFECALVLFTDALVQRLMYIYGKDFPAMHQNHANLE